MRCARYFSGDRAPSLIAGWAGYTCTCVRVCVCALQTHISAAHLGIIGDLRADVGARRQVELRRTSRVHACQQCTSTYMRASHGQKNNCESVLVLWRGCAAGACACWCVRSRADTQPRTTCDWPTPVLSFSKRHTKKCVHDLTQVAHSHNRTLDWLRPRSAGSAACLRGPSSGRSPRPNSMLPLAVSSKSFCSTNLTNSMKSIDAEWSGSKYLISCSACAYVVCLRMYDAL
jgi:hypothetical protein